MSISVQNLSVSYGANTAIRNISFALDSPGMHGIIGPNGSGKSTLMKAMLQILDKHHVHGTGATGAPAGYPVTLDGKNPAEQRQKIAYIEQRSDLDRNFPTSVFDTVLMGTYPRLGLFHRPGKAEREAATQALKDVDMWDFRHRHISELSGGQFQRVLFARAIVQDAEYIFLDEPFVGIDVPSEKTIVTLLRQMADAGKHVVVVHHDMNTVRNYYDDLIVLNGELIAAGPTEEVFVPDVLQKAFGALVIRAPAAAENPMPRQAALQEEKA